MANTKISALTANTNPNGSEEFVYAYNNANGKITLNTMKAFVGGAGITTLNADANIWELNPGIYETAYALYYKTGEAVRAAGGTGVTIKQMLFVVEESSGNKGFFVFNSGHYDATHNYGYASYGYSLSSTVGECNVLGAKDWSLKAYDPYMTTADFDSFHGEDLTQIVNDAYSDCELRISSSYLPYPGVTYTAMINSVQSGQTYNVILGNGITNPFGITLPTSSTKKCLITVLITGTTTGIVTSCIIEP